MDEVQFTKRDTSICKGIAIILMFIHHLFGFSDRIKNGSEYISLFVVSGINIELWIAQFGKICVAMFLFFSGFGMYKKWSNNININNNIFNKLKILYINYWVTLIIFIPISFLLGNRIFHLGECFDNFIGYSSSYNPETWFLELYILTMITFPISVKIISDDSLSTIFRIILIAVSTHTILPYISSVQLLSVFSKTVFFTHLLKLLYWLPCFLMGCTFSKFYLFSKIKEKIINNKLDNIFVYILICISIIYIRKRNVNTTDFDYLLVPMFIISSMSIIKFLKLNNIFYYFGKHSTNMWLVHSYFCCQYFQKAVYYPKISIIIVIWLTILSLITSIAIIFIEKSILKLYYKRC